MDELLDTMYARVLAEFKASPAGNVLEATNLTTVQLYALSRAAVESVPAGLPIFINLPEQYGKIKVDTRVQFWGNYACTVEQEDARNIFITLNFGEFLYVLNPNVEDYTGGTVYIARVVGDVS